MSRLTTQLTITVAGLRGPGLAGADLATIEAAVASTSADVVQSQALVGQAEAATAKVIDQINAQSTAVPAIIGRPVNPVDGTAVTGTNTYVQSNAVPASGYLQSVKIFVKAAGTVTIGRYTLAGSTITRVATYTFTTSTLGLQTFTFGTSIPIVAGELLSISGPGLWTFSGSTPADGTGWYSVAGATPASASTGALVTSGRLEVQFNHVSYVLVVTGTAFTDLSNKVSVVQPIARNLLGEGLRVGRTADPVTGVTVLPNSGQVWGDPVPTGAIQLSSLKLFVPAAGNVTIARYSKSGSTGTLIASYTFAAGSTGAQTFTEANFGTIPLNAGEYLGLFAPGVYTFTSGIPSDGVGWYAISQGTPPASASLSTLQTSGRLEAQFNILTQIVTAAAFAQVSVSYFSDRVLAATVSPSALSVTTSVSYGRDGATTTYTDTRTLAPSSGSNVRYDVLYIDAETKAFGVVSGTERATDAYEWIPSLGSSSRVAIANLRVTSAGITVVPVWNLYDGVDRSIWTQVEQERERSRNCLRKFRAKMRKGAPLRIVALGDSIQQIGSAVGPTNVPNGLLRDVGAAAMSNTLHYLRDAIGTPQGDGNDVVDNTSTGAGGGLIRPFPLYTSVQLGRADDGGGAIHTKFGFMWELVNALDDAGYTLGTDLFYDNFGISGAQSTGLVTSGAPSAWTNAAVALAPDLIVMHMGMNEYNSATTEASMIIAINAAKAAGIECVVMGVELRNNSQSLVGWELTNRSLRRAAEFTGVAFLSTLPLYDARFPGALGVAAADRCAANRINHPGIREHAVIGRELIKTVMG